jgi:hypothetical protein
MATTGVRKPIVIKNTADLREMLIGTIQQVRDGEIDYRQATAISGLTTKILQSAKLDLEVLKFRSLSPSADGQVLQLTGDLMPGK